MSLAEAPLVLVLLGLTAYVVLGGADFGAGFWQLASGKSERSRAIREHAHNAMGPVWEANHVWLIFVLVVCWTAYPTAFGSIASTLAVPLFVAAIGIIMRGTAYALRAVTATSREQRRVEVLFSLSSILTPFALGAAIGGIASGRVPVGNARGDLVTSWLNPTSILVGTVAVATAAYLAAVYLAADAARIHSPELARDFRVRALAAGGVAGALAVGGLAVLHSDARPIWDGLTHGWGLAALAVSGVSGIATLVLVHRSRFEPARVTAALAVAAIVGGWAAAQSPQFLPGLTIEEAAAPRATLIAILVATALGAVVLGPALALLFGLFLRGTLDPDEGPSAAPATAPTRRGRSLPLGRIAAGCFVAGSVLSLFAGPSWARALGIAALFAFIAAGFAAITIDAES